MTKGFGRDFTVENEAIGRKEPFGVQSNTRTTPAKFGKIQVMGTVCFILLVYVYSTRYSLNGTHWDMSNRLN